MKTTLILLSAAAIMLTLFFACTPKTTSSTTTNQSTTPAAPINNFGQELSLKYGDQIMVGKENIKISFLDIQDSRCPKEVNCMVAGKAIVQLQVQASSLNETVDLTAKGLCYKMDGSCGSDAMAGGYKIQMINVDPYPIEKNGDKGESLVKFIVSK